MILTLALTLATAHHPRHAPRGHRPAPCYAARPTAAYGPPPAPAVRTYRPAPADAVAPPPRPPAGDPYNFTAWLNGQRAAYGLPGVSWDAGMAGAAHANSLEQFNRRTVGHFARGDRRQNAGAGQLGPVEAAWMASGAHRAALLDPRLTRVGVAGVGAYWTFSGE